MRIIPYLLFSFCKTNVQPRFYHRIFDNNCIEYSYGTQSRRDFKQLKKYTGYVQDHHCIPKQFRNHKLLRETGFNVNSAYNIVIMPNHRGIEKLNLHPDCRIHYNGHLQYNKYVGKQLGWISSSFSTLDEKRYQIWLLLHYLKDNIKYNDTDIPWK